MKTKPCDRLDKTEPALIVKYGHSTRKYFTLERTGITLGRARGCDIELEAPDISAIHCIITRGPGGLFVRDCSSRAGTKINGEKVHEALLHNGDMLLVGTFSFEVFVPWQTMPQDISNASLYKQHLQRSMRSRERLARLALTLRRRLQTRPRDCLVDTVRGLPHEFQDKAQQHEQAERALAERQAELARQQLAFEERARQLEEEQARFRADRATATHDFKVLKKHLVRVEQELAQRQARVEAEIQVCYREMEQHAAAVDQGAAPAFEEARRLNIRHHELAAFARHLRRCQQALPNPKDMPPLDRLVDDLQNLHAAAQQQLEVLRHSNAVLQQAGARSGAARETVVDMPTASRAELACLREQLAHKEALLDKLRRQAPPPAPVPGPAVERSQTDVERGEAELETRRRKLVAERAALEEETRQLEDRDSALCQTVREMELAIARERAQLAHERATLERLRRDFQQDLEVAQRDPLLRERLALLQRPKNTAGEQQRASMPTPRPFSIPDRLKALLGRERQE